MKFEFDKKLLKYSIYITITAVIIYIAFLIIFNIGTIFGVTFDTLGYILGLIKPLIIGIIIAYLLYPLTKAIEKFLEKNKVFKIKKASIRRILAITLSYLLIVGIFSGLLLGIYFMIGGQLSNNTTLTNITQHIGLYISNTSFSPSSIKETLDKINNPLINSMNPYIVDGVVYLQKYVENNLGNMTSYVMSIGSSVAIFFIALVISIYLLKDSEYFFDLWHKIYNLIFRKSKVGGKITYVFKVIHQSFSNYLKGQLLEAFFVGVLSAVSLSIVGIDYAIIIGIFAGITNMIPYVGPIVGTVLAAIMGLLSGTPINVLYAVIAMLIVQQIDGHLLAPKIVGDSVGLHAVFIIIAILIGGDVGGILGMLLAVPIAASLKVLINNWYENHTKVQTNSDDIKNTTD
ncbi:putative PurR-regulated permease PerM [Clostridium saccharoperbutylacetonicum]|uniref:Putative permease n=1 Tax=Clostridium saccharoperbutylacetonicum N1-4(HMT) TaxID=931276 RepID=M1MNY7_9CLOT|nr:AI-2E family transporter [Clostridium saccharoperbutylacetonicum]AGF57923.1 putative permease [Clostridium saccharoperbutylacetonicum N1-4(HMT)]NRT61304.1 putative PurR-regulated permease PerM [Clostridium saccharoperbutylacetonicum]NSB24621.1 putative PurR-regulated permease PerM [Clostridium saccharoperbutylacetonicum]NSB43996.1 putative PurR-regulated permease PerM [Clostridium saccharoperbutylacetonicum]